jgi:hypothetical protein
MTSEKDGRFLKLLRMGIGRDMGKRGGRERLEGERGGAGQGQEQIAGCSR